MNSRMISICLLLLIKHCLCKPCSTCFDEQCEECVRAGTYFYKLLRSTKSSANPRYQCPRRMEEISKHTIITEIVCNITLCRGIQSRRPRRILYRDEID